MAQKPNVWETTNVPNLLKNCGSGRFYGRFTVRGKQKWVNLHTDVWSVAKLRLSDERTRFERQRQIATQVAGGCASMGGIATVYRQRIADQADIKSKTRQSKIEKIDTIVKTWPGFERLGPRDVTRDAVSAWRNRIRREGTGYKCPGARGVSRKNDGSSASLINQCIDALRRMLDIAVERGQLGGNCLATRGLKLKDRPRKPKLPEPAVIAAVFDEIERNSGGRGLETADFCRLLAYSGARLNEARRIRWCDVDLKRGILRVHGEKTEAAEREVAISRPLRSLIERMRERREAEVTHASEGKPLLDPREPVCRVGEASRSLKRACEKLGIEKLTHHDLRDAFATLAIEAGVDVPTVASWLGHVDGGALLMRVYTHHRRDHSLKQAEKLPGEEILRSSLTDRAAQGLPGAGS